ncbi:MAG TPA: Ig-like domain-containing protein [Thermoanaerobaculia bacterium]
MSIRLLLSFLVLGFAAPLFAHDVTVSGTTSFAALDGSANDHDGAANGVFTVSDGNLVINGTVNCNDDGASDSACSMAFAVSGNLTINSGAALYAENRTGGGSGGNITFTVGGNVAMNGTALVSTSSRSSTGATGGNIAVNAGGSVTLASGTTIDAGAANARAGNVTVAAGGTVALNGNVLSGPSRTLLATRLTGAALDGGTANQQGGAIAISSSTFAEPSVVIGSTANIVAQGETTGAGPVTIDGCGVQVYGLVAALSRKDAPARIAIRSGKDVVIDGRDLGVAGATTGRLGRVRADAPSGTAVNKSVDIFAAETVDLFGPASSASTQYAISAIPGQHDAKSYGGTIRVISLGDVVNATGLVVDDGHTASGDTGGSISFAAKGDVNLAGASIRAIGDFNTNNANRGGGTIQVRSYSGNIIWTGGLGEVRPVGSSSGLTTADQGAIVLTACGTINTTGTSFPVMGTATSVFPETHTGVCSPAAPSLPAGVPPLVTCNTPPVANDTAAATFEDTSVTITLTGSDADGDALTFSIVSGPAHGSLSSLQSTGPTSATVVYTPAPNYNGVDSFTFRANDGNGGTDDAIATVTITPVNDAPSFQIGPTATSFEDAGAQTYPGWVSSISAGPADEAGQSVTFTVTNDNPSLFSVQPAVAPNGTLTYAAAPNAYGIAHVTVVAHDNGGTANGGSDTSAPQTSTISVSGVNDAPSFTGGGNVTVGEDSGAYSAPWASGISAGPNESQNVSFVVTNGNNALFAVQPAVSASGVLTFTPAADANGVVTVSVYAHDDGGTANGGVDDSAPQTFTITINAVNDAPSFTAGGNVTVLEDSGAYSAAWASAISAGPADEAGQSVTFTTTNSNNALFASQPSVDASGTLTFTLAANSFGSATVTVVAHDNGGTANGGADTSAAQTFTITVSGVNDEPSFTAGGNPSVLEDSGAYSAAWASGISAGPGESQNVTFHVSNDNNALFAGQPAISASGVLTFVPAADANGTATVTVYLTDDGGTADGGDDTSSTVTFTITVTPVNDEPSFTSGGNVSVGEDSGAYSAAWASAISAGPANESSQTVVFVVTSSNTSLFSVQPSVASDGTLTFTPALNGTGSATITIAAQDNGGTANGGADTSAAQTFTITVSGVNDPPSFALAGASTSSLEDGGPRTVLNWATSISSGAGESDNVTFTVTNDNNTLFAVQPAIAADGTLTYTAAPDASGIATVSVIAKDDGGTANGGNDTSASQTFTIVIDAVNDAPSFTGGANQSVLEDAAAQTVSNWATNISAGPSDEASQTLTFTVVSNSNPSLFSTAPAVAADGTLTYAVAANAFGSATIGVRLSDSGGTANGGVDNSAVYTFTITVDPVNDAPSFTAGGDVTVNEDSGAYSAAWASAISAGPSESGQTLNFVVSNSNNSLFSAQPAISASGVLTFTPAPNKFGVVTVTVALHDNGGTANGGTDTSASVTFTLTINGVNDGPTAGNDVFETFGNTEVRVDLGAGATPHVLRMTGSGNGVLANDADAGEGDPISVTSIVGCADTTAPYDCVLAGGARLSMNANGTFSYVPAPGASSGSFQYVATDNPSAGSPASTTGTVTIVVTNMVWYVNGSAGASGNGTSIAPYNSFAFLSGSGDLDNPGDTIYVESSVVSGSIAMEANQHLIGQGVALTLLQSNAAPYTLAAAGSRPRILGGSATPVTVTGVSGVEIAGCEFNSTGNSGIDVRSNLAGPAAAASIHDNIVNGAALQGIVVRGNSASGTTVAVSNTNVLSTGTGFEATSTAGTVNVAYNGGTITSSGSHAVNIFGTSGGTMLVSGLSNLTLAAPTSSDALVVTNATVSVSAGGTISAGSASARVRNGVAMSNVTGSMAFGTLNAFTTGGKGLSIVPSGSFTVTSTAGTINSVNGSAISLSGVTIGAADLTLTSVSSTNAVNGILLANTGSLGGLHVTGSGTAGSGGSLTGHSGDAVSLATTADVSLGYMSISSNGGNGVRGSSVDGFVADHCTVSSNGNDATTDESGIYLSELTGSSTRPTRISNSTISNNFEFQVVVSNSTASLPDFRMTDDTVSSNGASGTVGNLVNFLGLGNANMSLTVTGGTYTGNAPSTATAVHADHSGSGSMTANVSGATFTNNNVGVNASAANAANLTFDLDGNTLTGTRSHALNVFLAANHTGVASGKIRNNVIGTFGVTGSGSQVGVGIRVQNDAVSAAAVLVDNNSISELSGFPAVNVNVGVSTSTLTQTTAATITNNTIRNVNSRAIVVQQNVGKGTLCADISNNSMSGIAGQAGDGTKMRLRQLAGGTFNVRQKAAGAAADPLELDDANSVGANVTTAAQVSVSGTFNYNAGACAQP